MIDTKDKIFEMMIGRSGDSVIWPIFHKTGITFIFLIQLPRIFPEVAEFIDGWKCRGCGGFEGALGMMTFPYDERSEPVPALVTLIQENRH